MNSKNDGFLSKGRLAAFTSPDAPMAILLMVVIVYVPPFYAGEMGLGLSVVGLVFGLTKLWDVVTDPLFGIMTDRWYTRWGRRKPWLVVSVPLLMVSAYMVFVPTAPVSSLSFAVWMILFYVGWTMATISHISWSAELSTDYHERSRIAGYKQAAAIIGALAVLTLVAVADHLPGFDAASRLAVIAVAVIILFPVTIFSALWAVPEKRYQVKRKPENNTGGLWLILTNGPLLRLLGANLCLGIAGGASAGMFLFYVEKVLRLGDWASFSLIPMTFSGLLFLPLMVAMCKWVGKHRALCYAALYQIGVSVLFLFVPADNLLFACVAFTFIGATAVNTFIPQAIMADITDLDAIRSGNKRTGLQISLLQSTSKIAAALSIGVSYPLLSMIGFDPAAAAENSADTLDQFRWLMFLLPAAAQGVVLCLMWRFPLDELAQKKLKQGITTSNNEADEIDAVLVTEQVALKE